MLTHLLHIQEKHTPFFLWGSEDSFLSFLRLSKIFRLLGAGHNIARILGALLFFFMFILHSFSFSKTRPTSPLIFPKKFFQSSVIFPLCVHNLNSVYPKDLIFSILQFFMNFIYEFVIYTFFFWVNCYNFLEKVSVYQNWKYTYSLNPESNFWEFNVANGNNSIQRYNICTKLRVHKDIYILGFFYSIICRNKK